jgi:hypothetical protein
MWRIGVFSIVTALFLTSAIVLAQVLKGSPTPPIEFLAQIQKSAAPPPEGTMRKQPAAKDAMKPNPTNLKTAAGAVAFAVREHSVRNLTNQLLPVLRMELLFARTVGRLTKEQLRQIRPEADAMFLALMNKLADADPGAGRGVSVAGATYRDARTPIREGVSAIVRRHVSAERWAAWEVDIQRRDANRKEAAIGFFVAALDRDLLLSHEQRDQLTESLSSHWDDTWTEALELNLYGNPFVPKVPDELITPYLSDAQTRGWRGMRTYPGGFWGHGIDGINDPVLDEELGGTPRVYSKGRVPKQGIVGKEGPMPKR